MPEVEAAAADVLVGGVEDRDRVEGVPFRGDCDGNEGAGEAPSP